MLKIPHQQTLQQLFQTSGQVKLCFSIKQAIEHVMKNSHTNWPVVYFLFFSNIPKRFYNRFLHTNISEPWINTIVEKLCKSDDPFSSQFVTYKHLSIFLNDCLNSDFLNNSYTNFFGDFFQYFRRTPSKKLIGFYGGIRQIFFKRCLSTSSTKSFKTFSMFRSSLQMFI